MCVFPILIFFFFFFLDRCDVIKNSNKYFKAFYITRHFVIVIAINSTAICCDIFCGFPKVVKSKKFAINKNATQDIQNPLFV